MENDQTAVYLDQERDDQPLFAMAADADDTWCHHLTQRLSTASSWSPLVAR